MATGRIGVTPTLRTRWSEQPTAGTTVLSGLDDNSVALVYDAGYEAVYRNGVLLSRGNDYTATDGTTITLIDATLAGDIIEVFANDLIPLTDAISKAQYTAKGVLLSASAASTPGVVTVGANDTVLTADSSTATGLKWATPSSGGITLITETVASANTSISFSSIPSTYKQLMLVWSGVYHSTTGDEFILRFNSATTGYAEGYFVNITSVVGGQSNSGFVGEAGGYYAFGQNTSSSENRYSSKGFLLIDNYASTTKLKNYEIQGSYRESTNGRNIIYSGTGVFNSTSAITSLDITRTGTTATITNAANTSIRLYGIS